MLPNHAPLMVAERFKVLEALFPGTHRSRPRPRARHRSGHLLCAAAAAGDRRGRFPGAVSGADPVREQRIPGGPSVPQGARHAGRRGAAADLAARIERLQRAARRHGRRRLFVRAPFRRARRARRHAELPRTSSSRRRRGRHPTPFWPARWCAPTPTPRPSGSPRPSISISCAGGAASICRWRARRRPPRFPYSPAERGLIARNRARLFVGSKATVLDRLGPMIEATKADEVMVTTHDLRPRRAPALLRVARGGVRAAGGTGRHTKVNPGRAGVLVRPGPHVLRVVGSEWIETIPTCVAGNAQQVHADRT